MKKLIIAALLLLSSVVASNATTYTYVGNWHVGDGPVWTSNPQSYSGIEVAALLFGGSALDYAISTVSSSVTDINFRTFLDGYGNTQYLSNPAAQDYKLQTGASYNSYPSFSAYVLDHTETQRYYDPSLTGDQLGDPYINYAFIIDQDLNAVPEPGTVLLFGIGMTGLAIYGKRRKQNKA